MTILGVLAGAVATVLTALLAYLGGRRVQASQADKNAVDGYDLLTGRLEARLEASEKREEALLARVKAAENEATECRQRVEHLERILTAHGITEENA